MQGLNWFCDIAFMQGTCYFCSISRTFHDAKGMHNSISKNIAFITTCRRLRGNWIKDVTVRNFLFVRSAFSENLTRYCEFVLAHFQHKVSRNTSITDTHYSLPPPLLPVSVFNEHSSDLRYWRIYNSKQAGLVIPIFPCFLPRCWHRTKIVFCRRFVSPILKLKQRRRGYNIARRRRFVLALTQCVFVYLSTRIAW